MIQAIITGMFAPLAILASISMPASALSMDSGDNHKIYLRVSDGKQISPIDAFKAAIKDEAILECAPVEAVGNQRTGKVALKKKK